MVLEFPVLIHGLDGPIEFLAQCLGEEALDGDIEFLREDDGEAGIDVILSPHPRQCPDHDFPLADGMNGWIDR